MGKNMGKRSAAAKRAAAKKKASKGPVNRKDVREEIAGLVASSMAEMTTAMIEEAKKGCLPQYKCLLEVTSVFPPANGEESAAEDSNVLAQILLDRLQLPNRPEEELSEDAPAAGLEETVSVE